MSFTRRLFIAEVNYGGQGLETKPPADCTGQTADKRSKHSSVRNDRYGYHQTEGNRFSLHREKGHLNLESRERRPGGLVPDLLRRGLVDKI
jgi:hypothetical protein